MTIAGTMIRKVCTLSVYGMEHMVYSANLNGDIKKLTDGMYDYGSVAMAGDKIITKRHSISAADEIYTLTPADGQVAQLSHENDHIFKQLNLGKVEERWTKTTDGKQMLSWVIYPVNFDANKKYPTLLFCEGGRKSGCHNLEVPAVAPELAHHVLRAAWQ